MKFNTIKIDPDQFSKKWIVYHFYDDQDREEVETKPHSLGFFHYPETMTKEEAFYMLKQSMIENHEKEIKRISESLEQLKLLALPKEKRKRKKA